MAALISASACLMVLLSQCLFANLSTRRGVSYVLSKPGLSLRKAGDCFMACGMSPACREVLASASTSECVASASLNAANDKENSTSARKIHRVERGNNMKSRALFEMTTMVWDFEPIIGSTPAVLHQGTIRFDHKRSSNVLATFGGRSAGTLGDFKGTCISNPILCENGVSFSFWSRFYRQPASSDPAVLFTIGGHTRGSLGYTAYAQENKIVVNIRIPAIGYTLRAPLLDFTNWFHVVFTWTAEDMINMFLNGVKVSEDGTSGAGTQSVDTLTTLVVGGFIENFTSDVSVKMDMDEFMVFEQQLDEEQVHEIYIAKQGR